MIRKRDRMIVEIKIFSRIRNIGTFITIYIIISIVVTILIIIFNMIMNIVIIGFVIIVIFILTTIIKVWRECLYDILKMFTPCQLGKMVTDSL